MNTYKITAADNTFTAEVEKRSGQDLNACYQCGNCTAGCPFSFAYDIQVSNIMRLVQIGQRDKVLQCHSIWLCASCQSCTTRCPNNIDVAGVMDHIRHMAREAGLATERKVKVFVDSFLDSVERHGRVYEMGLMVSYMAKTGRVFTDVELAPKVLPKGKLPLKPHSIKGKEQIAAIFKRFREVKSK
ncbi:4Fe-4S dicluster domain-containing protein [Desulforhopalus singaporensis]|uniref:Heterodisulfide reductase subunit C n=1 Tax=Desulforhopalus singaporensis TaxID=91360 RepID=A0A1H0SQ19_9BACT|nr:4Fe-4S dicluster domain-containing protein [Desulforhopalus singaporensis]SDP43830.1 heterodisulfide reductase subunit C [Desulforhopalus singaporensis]